jgi:uncharacterized protein YndB with AHSA1/START domain
MNMNSTTDRELKITREFQAPRELVWEAWTNPEHLVHWWGPPGSTYTIHEMNVKTGGLWRFIMHVPGGHDFPNRILYKEVIKPELLSYEHGSDIVNDPRKFYVTTKFEAKGKTTEVTTKMIFATAEQLKEVIEKYGALEVNRLSMLKLDEYLKTMQ